MLVMFLDPRDGPDASASSPEHGHADEGLVSRVRTRLIAEGGEVTARAVAAAVREETETPLGERDVLAAVRRLHREFFGAGPLEELLATPGVTDVLVTGPEEVWVDHGDGVRRADLRFGGEQEVRRLAQRLATATGRRLDDACPWVDGWLPGTREGVAVRLHAVLAPVAARGTCISLRVLRPANHGLDTLRELGTFDAATTELLRSVVSARLAFLVSGSTGAGKTTLLSALLGEVDRSERIVCVEEAGELQPVHPHVVRLVTRPPNIEGNGEIRLRDLVRQALRMRPDRLVVGETRGAEVCDLLSALNTGHEGGAGTVHANSPGEVPARMEALGAQGGLGRAALHGQLAAAVRVVLHMRRDSRRGRHLAGIGLLRRRGTHTRVVPAWDVDEGWGAARTPLLEAVAEHRPETG
ncbi:ATPase [Actinopolyspora mortivallis]|uniref:ATPase n=2 Tax=Actinopolyspora mortivallis TaxID=33906 RepID=A0A2T0GWD5_ACTMO|nr:ATPase [Actinopolyspora mortivallis]